MVLIHCLAAFSYIREKRVRFYQKRMRCLLKLGKEAEIVLVIQTNIVDAVFQHGDSFHA